MKIINTIKTTHTKIGSCEKIFGHISDVNWKTVDSIFESKSLPEKYAKKLIKTTLKSKNLLNTKFKHLEDLFYEIDEKIVDWIKGAHLWEWYLCSHCTMFGNNITKKIVTCIWAGKNLSRIMRLQNKKQNSFQPSKSQLKALQNVFGNFWSQLSIEEWLSCVTKESMFPSTWTKRDMYFSDQMQRANLIVDELVNNQKITQIIALDGHGSWQFCFWKCVTKAKQLGRLPENRDFSIVVVDFDKDVDEWHRSFLSKNTLSIFGNLFDLMKILSNPDVLSKSAYYFNFCGLGPSAQIQVHTYIHTNIHNVRGALTWMKYIPANMQVNIKRKKNMPSEKDLVVEIQKNYGISIEDIRTSLQICVSKVTMFPSDDIIDMLCGLFNKIPFECFSVPLILLYWIEELQTISCKNVIYLSYSKSRTFGKHKYLLQDWLLEEDCLPLTYRKDFLTFKVPSQSLETNTQHKRTRKTNKQPKTPKTHNTPNKKQKNTKIPIEVESKHNTRKRSAIDAASTRTHWNIGDKVEVDMNHIPVEGYNDSFHLGAVVAVEKRTIRVSFKGFDVAGDKSYWTHFDNVRPPTDMKQRGRPCKFRKGDDVEVYAHCNMDEGFGWWKGSVYSGGQEKITVKWAHSFKDEPECARFSVGDVRLIRK